MPEEGIEFIIVELSWEGRGTDSNYGEWVRNTMKMRHMPIWYLRHIRPKDLAELRDLLMAHRTAVRETVVVYAGAGRYEGVLLRGKILHYEALFMALVRVPWLGHLRLVHFSTGLVISSLQKYRWMCPISGYWGNVPWNESLWMDGILYMHLIEAGEVRTELLKLCQRKAKVLLEDTSGQAPSRLEVNYLGKLQDFPFL